MTPRGATTLHRRLVLGLLGLVLAVLTVVGITLFTVLRSQLEARVESELVRSADEFRVLATQGVDPATGQPFTGPDELLRTTLARSVLAPEEGVLGLVDGQIRWTAPEPVALRPEDDPELVALVSGRAGGDQVVVGGVRTGQRDYRYVVAPVRFASSPQTGALVRVHDMDAEGAALRAIIVDYAVTALVSLLGASLVVSVWVRRLLRPLGWLRHTATRITEEDLTERVPVQGTDELAELATTVNQMLDRIESGVTAQRRLLDDVGHELRTPVTVVRGHLELMDADDPAEVAATRTLTLEEVDRMGRLVDDLLTLAKAGQPDFVRRRPTEVAALTDGVLTRARALGDRRWTMSRIADVEARLDPDRVTQAWLQLAANAVQYSGPGSTVDVGSRVVDGELHLWVRDEGLGIAADELDAARGRFWRSDAVRRSVEGTGLGLSIVDSIATAHGGRLELTSELGTGTTATVVLPLQDRTEGTG